MEPDTLILVLRMAFAALLYLFIFLIAIVGYRQLKQPASDPRPVARPTAKAVTRPKVSVSGSLVVVEAAEGSLVAGRSYELLPVTTLGRHSGSTIVIPDTYASNEHAVLTWKEQAWWVEDAGSTNGTLLNRHMVQKPTKLNAGDIIQIGRVKLKIVL